MLDALKNFYENDLAEIRRNKIRFGALIIILAVTVIFALNDLTTTGTEIPVDAPAQAPPAPVRIPDTKTVEPVLGASSAELYSYDPFELPTPPPAPPPPPVETPPPLPPIPIAQIPTPEPEPAPESPAGNFTLSGVAQIADTKTALIHNEKNSLVVRVGDTLGGRRVTQIADNFVALEDGSRISLAP